MSGDDPGQRALHDSFVGVRDTQVSISMTALELRWVDFFMVRGEFQIASSPGKLHIPPIRLEGTTTRFVSTETRKEQTAGMSVDVARIV